MKKAVQRLYCNCGWEQWMDFDANLTDKQLEPEAKRIIQKHMAEAHGQFDNLEMKHIGHEKIKPKIV